MRFRPDRWLWGVPALLALWGGALWLQLGPVEDALRGRIEGGGGLASSDALVRSGARVEVEGRDVTVVTDVGLAPDVERSVVAALSALEGVRRVVVSTPLPVALDPYPFAIRLAGRLHLTGGVPSPAFHAELREAVGALEGAPRSDDRLRLATGAPPGFAEAALRLVQLAGLLSAGDLALTGTVYSATGDARDFASYNAARDLLAAPLRGFAPAEVAIRPPVAPAFGWTAERVGDVVTLTGFVPGEAARAGALAAARAAVPRGSVVDRTQTARGLDPSVTFDALATTALGALGRLQSGRVVLAGRTVTADGTSPARDLLGEVEADLRRGLSAAARLDALRLEAVPADPFRTTVSRGGGRVTLDGYLPDLGTRTRLLALVARRFPGEAIVDRSHLADGAPPGYAAAAESGLGDLAGLAEGTLALTGREMRLSGRVLYSELAARLRAAVPASAPPGWSAAADLDGPASERPLDALQCGDLLGDAARRQPVRFETGASVLPPTARPALDALAAVLQRCPPARIRVVQHAAAAGEGDLTLAAARVAALVDALDKAGLPKGVTLDGVVEPPASGEPPDRTEFRVPAPAATP